MGIDLGEVRPYQQHVFRWCWVAVFLSVFFVCWNANADEQKVVEADAVQAGADSIPAAESNNESLSSAGAFLSEAQQNWLRQNIPVRVGVTNIPPQVFRDEQTGQLSGLCMDHLRRIETLLGVPFEIVYYNTWNAMMDATLLQISPEQRQRLEAKWVFPKMEAKTLDWRIVYGVPIGIAMLLASVLLWNVLLRRSVKSRIFELQQELTERKKAEASLVESERKLSMLMDNLQGIVFRRLNRADWPMECLGKGCLELTGYPVQEFLSRPMAWNDLIMAEDRTPVWENIQEALRSRQTYQIEYRIITHDGQLKWLWEKGSGVFDANGNIVALEGFISDISHSKNIEEKLCRQETQLASIFKASPVGIGLLSNRVFLHVNDRVCAMTGYTQEELVGRDARILYPSQEEYEYVGREKYRQIKEEGVGTVETRWRCKDSKTIDVLLSSAAIDVHNLGKGVIFNALDITEAKTATQMAITERDKAQQYLDIAGVMMVVLDAEGRIKLLNKRGCEILECTESHVRGKDWFSGFLPESARKTTQKAFCDLIVGQGDNVEYFENSVITTTGKEKLIAWHNTVIRDEKGTIIGTLSSGLDITKQKIAEQALAESEQRFRNIIESSPIGVGTYTLEPDGRLILTGANEAAETILKRDLSAVLGKTIEEAFPELVGTDRPRIYREICEHGGAYHCNNFDYPEEHRGAGGYHEIHVFQTSPGKIAVMFMDMTNRIRTQHQLELTQFAVDHAGEAVFWLGLDAKFKYVNETACRVLKYSREELLTMSVQDIDPDFPADIWPRHWQEVKEKKTVRFESHHKTKDGHIFPVEITANFLEYEGREYMWSFVCDISERKAAETAQQKLMSELQSKNEELESIVFIASHDLRSPLVNIRGFTGELEKSLAQLQNLLANEKLGESARQQLEYIFGNDIPESIGFINAGNRKMDMLLNGLLRLSRVGTSHVYPTVLDMNQLLEGIINSFRFRIRQTDIEITIDAEIPACLGDAVLINQVFNNLVDNAIKYRSPDRPANIHISAEAKDRTVVYCVKDNGIGIAPEHIDKIFEIFHRLNPDSSQTGEGLGLTIVRRLLIRQDGRVWIDSKPGVGTLVYVELPKA